MNMFPPNAEVVITGSFLNHLPRLCRTKIRASAPLKARQTPEGYSLSVEQTSVVEVVKIVNGTKNANGYYEGKVLKHNGTTFVETESIWVSVD